MQHLNGLSFHPDGKRFALTAATFKSELWVTENFLPAPKQAAARAK